MHATATFARTLPPAPWRRTLVHGLAIAALALTTQARADLWAYLDENGTPHFASQQLDARYQLFYKGRSSLDPVPLAPRPPELTPLDAVREHAVWKRLESAPNVARFEPLVLRNARDNGLAPELVKAVIAIESGYEPAAVSDKGAVGLMQVMPATGERYGLKGDAKRSVVDKLKEPSINLRIGTRYLKDLLARFDGELALALAAYNAGEGVVDRYNGVPPYEETRDYVRLVSQFLDALKPPVPPLPVAAPAAPARVTIVKPEPKR
ncbi:MAG TPA: lytic transglycosylase domain-containing protein [Casimicrobiaceae bacterium]|nr:lytic transglycosylase domain-containing protein [Casimicrobiaceae bacterium]